ncbi:hypothetical protein DXG03_005556, partial [Asterophora parasitica]
MLWEADSADVFMDVWVHCLESHHHVYDHAALRVFPRGLSARNLMLTLGSGKRVTGFLSDWDFLDTKHHRDRTGGRAAFTFMAADRLVAHPPPHLYRHDLESFFYILVWAALHYDFPNRPRASWVHHFADEWNVQTNVYAHSALSSACNSKQTLL